MPRSERDLSVGGRNSRASNISNGSRGPTKPPPSMTKADMLASAPGVMSMLRSSTELGTESLGSRFSVSNRPQNRHSGTTSRMSTGSGHSQSSKRASSHRAWPSVSSAGRRRSITSNFSNLTVPHYLDTMPPSLGNFSDPASMMPPVPYFRDGSRSLSMTNTTQPPLALTNYRSLSSLRGHEPYPRPRSPYRYPTRLKRPGYRPSSPALSDITGLQSRVQHTRLGSGLRIAHGPPFPPVARPAPLYSAVRNRSSPSVTSFGFPEQMYGTFPPSLPGSRQGTPSIPDQPVPAMTPTHPLAVQSVPPDTPSSSPPTPCDVLGSTTTEPMIMSHVQGPARQSSVSSSVPMYYDYSEQFEQHDYFDQAEKQITQIYQETTSAPIPMGFVQRIKTILEERAIAEPAEIAGPHTPTESFVELPEEDIHELPASPVVKRITRELILANLEPTSDERRSGTPSSTHNKNYNPQVESNHEVEQSTKAAPYSDHDKNLPGRHAPQGSVVSEVLSVRSCTTTATAAIEYALHYSMPLSNASLRSGMEVFLPDAHVKEEPAPIFEEPSEPVTIATAEVEVAAPTPTQPRWTPKFETPIDPTRPQSAFVSSSIYSSSRKDLNSRFSSPTGRNDWQITEDTEGSTQANVEATGQVSIATIAQSQIEQMERNLSPLTTPQIEVEQPTQNFQPVESPISVLASSERNPSIQLHLSPVSPLSPQGRCVDNRDSNTTTHLGSVWAYRKPVPRRSGSPASTSTRTSLKDSDSSKEQAQDSTTDLRFSTLRPMARHLDDVKEEPTLEHSSVDLRASSFKFPLPARKSSLAHFEEFRLSRDSRNTSADSGRDSAFCQRFRVISEQQPSDDNAFRPPSGVVSLADMRSIPSLNFSRQDLFSKLNEALDLRRTSSCDDFPQLFVPTPVRPVSSDVMREKYRSFFQSLDNMTSENIRRLEREQKSATLSDEAAQQQAHAVDFTTLRPLSPDELIAELDRISIPSINGLTQRLSEWVPSLRRYYGEGGLTADGDETVRSALAEIRGLGRDVSLALGEDRPLDFATQTKDEEQLIDELANLTEESTYESTSNIHPARPRSASFPDKGLIPPIAELEAPSPAVLRSRSLSDGNASATPGYTSISKLMRSSHRSLQSSPTDSRPWNLDVNYPWANTMPAINISLPAPVLRRNHVKPRPSRLRLRDDASDTDDVGTDLGSALTVTADPTDTTGATADTFSNHNSRRKISKRSIIGSISRKIGLKSSIDHSGYATGPDLLRGEDRAVDPGDRYPTTGLSPPSALNIDEVRSFFSDDSSHGEAVNPSVSFRKRLTNFRTRLPPISRAHSALEQRTIVHDHSVRRSNSLFVPNGGPRSMASSAGMYGDSAAGMPKTEFRARKLVKRMKVLWYKGGELLRTLSGKRKPNRDTHDWEESGESANWSNV